MSNTRLTILLLIFFAVLSAVISFLIYKPSLTPEIFININEDIEPEANLLVNGNFENGTVGWKYYSDKSVFLIISNEPSPDNSTASKLHIGTIGTNTQLLQDNIILEPKEKYVLTFTAKSSKGNDVVIYIQQSEAPFRNLGLNNHRADLKTEWETFRVEFTTPDLDNLNLNSRIRFSFNQYGEDGEDYFFDNVILVKEIHYQAFINISQDLGATHAPSNEAQIVKYKKEDLNLDRKINIKDFVEFRRFYKEGSDIIDYDNDTLSVQDEDDFILFAEEYKKNN